jgi:hypothetical protein
MPLARLRAQTARRVALPDRAHRAVGGVRRPAGDCLEALTNLRPQVIVVASQSDQLAGDSAKLVAQLLASPQPTVLSLAWADGLPGSARLLVHQLGLQAAA